jgi:hypothetical protein
MASRFASVFTKMSAMAAPAFESTGAKVALNSSKALTGDLMSLAPWGVPLGAAGE